MLLCWCWGVGGQLVVVELTAFLNETLLLSPMAGFGMQTIVLFALDKPISIALENKFPPKFIVQTSSL